MKRVNIYKKLGLYDYKRVVWLRSIFRSFVRFSSPNRPPLNRLEKLGALFIHIPKCGGSAIHRSLCGVPSSGHLSIGEYMRGYTDEKFDRLFKFSIVRNPWDRLVSAYRYFASGGNTPWDQWVSDTVVSPYQTFEQFATEALHTEEVQNIPHFQPQCRFICLGDSNPKLDYLGFFEDLSKAFRDITDVLEIDVELEKWNASVRKSDFREYYDTDSIEAVSTVYARDISLFNYSFE